MLSRVRSAADALPRPVRQLLIAALVIGVLLWLDIGPTPKGPGGFAWLLDDTAWQNLVLFTMVNVMIALSLNVINGMAGQFSIGHAGFVGIGAYTGAMVAANLNLALGLGNPYETQFKHSFFVVPLVMLASGVAAAIFGFLVGLPSLRLKGDYLAIVTLGFAEIFRLLIATAPTGRAAEGTLETLLATTGGPNGYNGPKVNGIEQGFPHHASIFWVFGGLILFALIAWRLKFSGWGRALRALRDDEIAASAVGVDPTRYKVTSFVIAAAGAGVAGGLFATMQTGSPTVTPDSFTFQQSFDAITMVILGGSGSVSGAIVGGVFVTVTVKVIERFQPAVKEQLTALADSIKGSSPSVADRLRDIDLNALRMVIYAAILISLMILRPEGLFGERELFQRKRAAKKKKDDDGPPPAQSLRDVRPAEQRALEAADAEAPAEGEVAS